MQRIGHFIVRITLEPGGGEPDRWRASVTDTVTKERHYFQRPEELCRYLTHDVRLAPAEGTADPLP